MSVRPTRQAVLHNHPTSYRGTKLISARSAPAVWRRLAVRVAHDAAQARSSSYPSRSTKRPAFASTHCSWPSSSSDSGREIACSGGLFKRIESRSDSPHVRDPQQRRRLCSVTATRAVEGLLALTPPNVGHQESHGSRKDPRVTAFPERDLTGQRPETSGFGE